MKSCTYMYSVANLSVLIWTETSNTWRFRVILQKAWRSLVNLEVSYAWLVLLTFFGFSSFGLQWTYGGKKIVCFMRAFQMTFDLNNRSSLDFIEFKTTIPLWKTLNIREHQSTNTGRQSERCFGNDIGNFQFVMVILTHVTLFWTYRKFKMESSITDRKG